MSASTEIVISSQFNGPEGSGNGGYSAGLAAQFIDGPASVRLHAPPPLNTPLSVAREDAGVSISLGDTLVMSAQAAAPKLTPPPSPGIGVAHHGPDAFVSADDHILPTCFVCGPLREPGDGLCIYSGRVDGFDGVADVWTPHETFGDEEDRVRPEILWAALDCPSAFAVAASPPPMLLGSICAQIHDQPSVGEPLVVIGWRDRSEGRKHFSGTALYTADGDLVAQSDTLWIELKSH